MLTRTPVKALFPSGSSKELNVHLHGATFPDGVHLSEIHLIRKRLLHQEQFSDPMGNNPVHFFHLGLAKVIDADVLSVLLTDKGLIGELDAGRVPDRLRCLRDGAAPFLAGSKEQNYRNAKEKHNYEDKDLGIDLRR